MPPVLECKKGIRGVCRLKPRLHPLRQVLPIKIFIRISQQTRAVLGKERPHRRKHMGGKKSVAISQNADIRPGHGNFPKPLHHNWLGGIHNVRIFIFTFFNPLLIRIRLLSERLFVSMVFLLRNPNLRQAFLRNRRSLYPSYHAPHWSRSFRRHPV